MNKISIMALFSLLSLFSCKGYDNLPCNQPYTMTVPQCIAAARMVKPKVLIPYHFGQTDISGIPAALPEIDVRLRQMQ